MKRRLHVFTLFVTLTLSLCLATFGVFAAIEVTFRTESTVSFIAKGVYVEANGSIYRGDGLTMTQLTEADRPETDTTPNATYTMENYRNFDITEDGYVDPDSDSRPSLPDWIIGNVQFLSDQKIIEVRITFTNYSEFPIAVTVSNNTSSSNSIEMFEEADGLSYIGIGNTASYYLTFTLTSSSGNSSIVIDLDVTFEEAGSLGDYLSWNENGYWELEMGYYDLDGVITPLKWRMILKENEEETDVESVANYVKETPLQGTYYFLLNTYIENVFNCSFENWYYSYHSSTSSFNTCYRLDQYKEKVANNDYAVSNVREFLTGINVYRGYSYSSSAHNYTQSFATGQTQKENFISKFNIDSSPVYSMIEGRTLTDLYSNMSDSTTKTGVTFDTDILIPQETKDKLWLLSYYEASKITLSQSTSSDAGARSWNSVWWLRTPYYSRGYRYVYYGTTSGGLTSTKDIYNSYFVRPAFKISF